MITKNGYMPYQSVPLTGTNELTLAVDAAKRLILFTGDKDKLPGRNEYQLDSRIQTDFGVSTTGVIPDNNVGTIRVLNDAADSIYLTQIDGTEKGRVLSSGNLLIAGNMTVDTDAHTITEEFIIDNQGEGEDVTVIKTCDSASGVTIINGSGTPNIDTSDKISGTGSIFTNGTGITNESGSLAYRFPLTGDNNQFNFICLYIKSSITSNLYIQLADSGNGRIIFSGERFPISANVWTKFVLPINSPAGTVGNMPNSSIYIDGLYVAYVGVINATPSSSIEVHIDEVSLCNGTWAKFEVIVPDTLDLNDAATGEKWGMFFNNGSVYINYPDNTFGNAGLTGGQPNLPDVDSEYIYTLSGDTFYSMYGTAKGGTTYSSDGRGILKNVLNGTDVNAGTLTYSSVYGGNNHLGFALKIPPYATADLINKVQVIFICFYDDEGATTYEMSNDTDRSTGLQNMYKPYIVFEDPAGHIVDYYVFSKKPEGLSYTYDEDGAISSITVSLPANSSAARGQMKHVDLTLDSDSDGIPDFLAADQTVSVAGLLSQLDFVYNYWTQMNLTSSIVTNDFGITAEAVDIYPYAVAAGKSVYDMTPSETVTTATGDVSIYDVKDVSEIHVSDDIDAAGDCEVWDTVTTGDKDESNWIRVYDESHVFTGDTIVQNGLICFKVTSSGNAYIYVNINNMWTHSRWTYSLFTIDFILITPDVVEFTYERSTTNSGTCKIKRGVNYIESVSANINIFIDMTDMRFVITSNGVIFDGYTSNLTTSVSKTVDTDTQYAISITPGEYEYIDTVYASSGDTVIYARPNNDGINALSITSTTRRHGAIPYNSQMYWEAEDMVGVTGGSYYTGVDAYPFTGNTGVVLSVIGAKTGAPSATFVAGTYTVFIRGLSPDAIGTQFRFYDSLGSVVQTVAIPAFDSSFSIKSADITLTEEDAAQITSVEIYNIYDGSATLDYILIVPTGLIEQTALRSLVETTATESQLILPK